MEELVFDFDDLKNLGEEIPDLLDEVVEEPAEKKIQPFKKKKVARNYINNGDFCEALIKYKEDCYLAEQNNKPKPRIPNYIGECFMKLAEGLARRPNFFGYSYKDEMIADGIENCLMYFENFDITRKNPFAYFTQILWWCFVRRIQKEKKQQYIKYKATENFGILDEAELLELGDGQIKQLEVYENMYDFIRKFEETEFKKNVKNQKPKKTKAVGLESFLED
jgi:hypothetical protein